MKQPLLFISPVVPYPGGGGRHIRSYHFIDVMRERYDVHLLVIANELRQLALPPERAPFYRSMQRLDISRLTDAGPILRYLLFRCGVSADILYGEMPLDFRFATPARIQAAKKLVSSAQFEVVHIFRLYMAPFGIWMKAENPGLQLDLDMDDLESVVRRRFAQLYENTGAPGMAKLYRQEALKYERLEQRWLPFFDRVYVCSERDQEALRSKYNLANVYVAPNVINAARVRHDPSPSRPFTFLFIGNFGYYPNRDGLTYFVAEVLPLLRTKLSIPFTINLIGAGLSPKIQSRLAKEKEIQFIGPVVAVEEEYRKSDAVLVPIRAGGGTRIKALEAFANRLPVIATRMGLEGIAAQHGEHALVADSPAQFAECCARVAQDAGLRRRLSENAYQLVQERYSPTVLRQSLAKAWGDHEK